jgi:hypothetical protein
VVTLWKERGGGELNCGIRQWGSAVEYGTPRQ